VLAHKYGFVDFNFCNFLNNKMGTPTPGPGHKVQFCMTIMCCVKPSVLPIPLPFIPAIPVSRTSMHEASASMHTDLQQRACTGYTCLHTRHTHTHTQTTHTDTLLRTQCAYMYIRTGQPNGVCAWHSLWH